MKLTDYSKTKQGNMALFFDGEFVCSVSMEIFAAAGMSLGDEWEEEAVQGLIKRSNEKKAKEKALRLLSCRPYARAELMQRLCRNADEEAARAAVDRMEELGLLDDGAFGRRLAWELYQGKRYGIMRIRQELKHRGLSALLIEEILEELPLEEEDIFQQMRALLNKKYPRAWEDESVRRRAFAALARYGYRPGDIRRVLMTGEDAGDF